MPTVIELPGLSSLDVAPTNQSGPLTESQDLSTIGSTEISQFGFQPGQSLSKSSLVNCRDGVVSGVVTVLGGDEPTINLTTGTERLNHTVKLISLPQSVEMTHTTPTVILPERRNDPLLMAINMDSRQDYSMTGLLNRHLPSLIERDVHALKQVSTLASKRDMTIMPGGGS